jgi:cytochrome c oxidase subunit 2
LLYAVLLVALGLLLAACGGSDIPGNTLAPESDRARRIDDLFNLTVWIATVIFVLVQGAIIYVVFRYRHKKKEGDRPVKQIHGNTRLEIAWTIIPALILAGLAVPTVQTMLDNSEEPEDALQITVVGHQWWWEYQYADYGFVTANEMHIPVDKDVTLTLTTDDEDVIHSFWIPKLSGKRDVVPGHVNTLTLSGETPGTYLGQCAEFCGLSHANMRLRVIVDTQADFDAWVARQQQEGAVPADGLAAEGWELFVNKGCSACHAVDGTDAVGGGPNPGPNLTHLNSRSTFAGAVYDRNEENLRAWLQNPSALKPMQPDLNRGMPNLGLSDVEITALIAFLDTLD